MPLDGTVKFTGMGLIGLAVLVQMIGLAFLIQFNIAGVSTNIVPFFIIAAIIGGFWQNVLKLVRME